MNYNALKIEAVNAFKHYKINDKLFEQSMKNFYSEGKKNPSVAKIILDNTINSEVNKSNEIARDILKNSGSSYHTSFLFPITSIFMNLAELEPKIYLAAAATKKALEGQKIPFDRWIQKLPEKQEFDKTFEELYPRTKDLRNRMIFEVHRVELGKVTEKANWWQKILCRKSLAEYRELYPKSLQARAKLLMDGQIKQDTVTKRLSGFLKRSKYKSFLDNGFSFAKTK